MCLALLIKLIQGFTLWPALNPKLKNTVSHKEGMKGESTLWCHKNTSLGPASILIGPAFAHLALPVKGASTQQPPVYAHRWLWIRGSVPSALVGSQLPPIALSLSCVKVFIRLSHSGTASSSLFHFVFLPLLYPSSECCRCITSLSSISYVFTQLFRRATSIEPSLAFKKKSNLL